MRSVWFVGVAVAGVAGCAISEQAFPDVYADAVCSKLRKCDRDDFEDTYEDKAECEEGFVDAADAAGDFLETLGLEYNEDNARACVQAIRASECEGFGGTVLPDACDNVWD